MVLSQHAQQNPTQAIVRLVMLVRVCQALARIGFCAILLPALLLSALLISPHASASEFSQEESRLKVALIYNFSQFVEWPDTAFVDPSTVFSICVLGDERVTQILSPIQRRHYKSRPIRIKTLTNVDEARLCHILYLDKDGTSGPEFAPDKVLGEAPVLTISNDAKALENGFAIAFSFQDERVGLNMNLAAVRKAKLKVSAKLVEIANRVVGDVGR